MKRKFILLIVSSFGFGQIMAQTNTFPSSGNVGIGTLSPTVKLEVLGDVKSYNVVTGTSHSLISRTGDYTTGVGISSWTTSVGVTGAYSGWDIFYGQSGTGDRAIEVTNGSGTYFGAITGAGSEAPIYFGDSNHFIKSKYAEGVSIGTFGAATGIVLRETSGNVGIGTSSPSQKLDVQGGAYVSGNLGVGTSSPSQKLHVNGGALVSSLAGSGNRMVIAGSNGLLSTQAMPVGDNLGNHTATQNIRLSGFYLSNDGGNEGVSVSNSGLTTCSNGLNVSGGATVTTGNLNLLTGNVNIATSDDGVHDLNVLGKCKLFSEVGIGGASQTSWELTVHGNAQKSFGGDLWDTFSDKRLKNVNGPIEGALETVSKLKPITYTWNDLRNKTFGEDRPGRKFGFIAQEIQEVIPEFVLEGNDGYLRFNASGIYAILVAAIQEQSALLKKYEDKLQKLEGSMEACCAVSQNSIAGTSEIGFSNFKSVLHQNRPNPFNDRTVICYDLKDEFSDATIIVTDLIGMQKLAFRNLATGTGSVSITHSDLHAGIFLYSLILDGEVVDTKRMVVTK
jgi:hypothetical protein